MDQLLHRVRRDLTHTITGLPLGTTVTLLVRAVGGCLPADSQPVSATTRTDQVYIPKCLYTEW